LKAGNFCGANTPGLMNDFHDGVEPESSILAVCYHNMAVEHEHLGEDDKALQAYYKSVEVAGLELGPDHPITQAFAERADGAQANLEKKKREKERGGKHGKKQGAGGAKTGKMSEYDMKLLGVGKGGRTPRNL